MCPGVVSIVVGGGFLVSISCGSVVKSDVICVCVVMCGCALLSHMYVPLYVWVCMFDFV